MNELNDSVAKYRAALIDRVTFELRVIANADLDTQNVDLVGESLVHDFLRSVHNGIVYVRGVRGIRASLDAWEGRKRDTN